MVTQALLPTADLSNKSSKRSVSTNSNDAASQRSCNCTPAGQQQPSQRKYYQHQHSKMLTNACHFLVQSHANRNICQQRLQTNTTSSKEYVTPTSSYLSIALATDSTNHQLITVHKRLC
ncbi:hypothetical protein F511_09785 [Dorcoceras hygrometricum]|uniref:Uncharacterized protein n=1 Tax=Dorcoceras hygrometricum TaxID=472368 RepID=A0A2Z7A5P0_9LAMI|nr:hypothetical protein F511_09785 [Dorcoceras hygrometricum]